MRKFILSLFFTLSSICLVSAQDWAKFGRYEKSNSEVTQKPKAVFMGDSITDGWATKDPDFFSDNNFIGRGISGQTTSHMLVRFQRDVVDLAPKYVLILAGTNDIAKNNGDITLANVLGNIKSMCEIAKANKIKPVICSVLPADRFGWRPGVKPAEEIVKLNKMLKEYADSQKIMYIDYYSVLADENGGLPAKHASDGVHPNLSCYKIMEQIVLDTL
ncbi:MAG: acylhydrolase [Bacteroidales bacterium]|nr:acylhydrolase [Bacteroidales bacterium]